MSFDSFFTNVKEKYTAPKGRGGRPKLEPKPPVPCFDKVKERAEWALEQSITQARGYFGVDVPKSRASATNPIVIEVISANGAKKAIEKTSYFPAPNWTITNRQAFEEFEKSNEDDPEKIVYANIKVSLKAGKSTQIPIFPEYDKEGNPTGKRVKSFNCKETEIVPALEGLLKATQAMEKDDEIGKIFHNTAIEVSKPNVGNWKYDVATDLYVKQ